MKTLAQLELKGPHTTQLVTCAVTITLQRYDVDVPYALSLIADNDVYIVCCIKLTNNSEVLNSVIQSDIQVIVDYERSKCDRICCGYTCIKHEVHCLHLQLSIWDVLKESDCVGQLDRERKVAKKLLVPSTGLKTIW